MKTSDATFRSDDVLTDGARPRLAPGAGRAAVRIRGLVKAYGTQQILTASI